MDTTLSMTSARASAVTQWVAVACILIALLVAPFYYGGTIGAWAICAAAGALLVALGGVARAVLVFPSRVALAGRTIAALSLVYLAVNYQQSISADTSIVPTWSIALLPLSYLVASALDRSASRALLGATFGLVFVVAAFAAFRFVVFGERATLPLIDPNNFSTLVYLVWIPLVHAYLVVGRVARGWHVAAALATLAMTLALFAAQSRGGNAIVLVALLIWSVLAAFGRVPRLRTLTVIMIAALAFLLADHRADIASEWTAVGVGGAVGVRGTMIAVALDMFREHPFTGVGVACFRTLYAVLRPQTEQETMGAFVHNDYVQFLAEGGIPLFVLLATLALAAAIAFVRGITSDPSSPKFRRAGLAMALAAACAHASINFVFYIAPLAIVVGLCAGALWRGGASHDATVVRLPLSGGVVSLVVGCIAWGYFVLDILTYGVFHAEPAPGATWIRSDPERALAYARVASQINADRALPWLGAASIVHQQAMREPESVYLREKALADFRRALAADPWNPVAYINMARHVGAFPVLRSELAEGESEEELLLEALSVDPDNVTAIEGLRAYYGRIGEVSRYAALLEVVVLPRLEAFKRNGAETLERYMNEIETFARAKNDEDVLARVAAERERLASIEPVHVRVWNDPFKQQR